VKSQRDVSIIGAGHDEARTAAALRQSAQVAVERIERDLATHRGVSAVMAAGG
jgi:hypothetical protein